MNDDNKPFPQDPQEQDPLLIKVEPLSILHPDIEVEEQDPLEIKRERYPVPILPRLPPTATALIIPVIVPPDQLALESLCAANTSQWDQKPRILSADQRRRNDIKNGFDVLQGIIPHLSDNHKGKLSNGAVLQKSGEYIKQLKSERDKLHDEVDCLQQEIEELNMSIRNLQSKLPENVTPIAEKQMSQMQELFDDFIQTRSMGDWKYWIFSLLFRPLLDSFDNFISNSSLDDLHKSTILWIEQHCKLVDLRPVVLDSLKFLSTKTEILTKPDKFPEEVRGLVLVKKPHLDK